MRVALAIAVGLACPSAAAAQAAGDRYGPPSAARLNAAAAAAYRGPTLNWSDKQAQATPAALPNAPAPYRALPPAYAPFQPQVPLPLRQAAAPVPASAQALPASLYGQAAPTPAAAPQRLAAAASPRSAGGATRFYSVHRGYGLAPDAIPEPPAGQRYVLIGPPDAPAQAEAGDDAPDASSAAF